MLSSCWPFVVPAVVTNAVLFYLLLNCLGCVSLQAARAKVEKGGL